MDLKDRLALLKPRRAGAQPEIGADSPVSPPESLPSDAPEPVVPAGVPLAERIARQGGHRGTPPGAVSDAELAALVGGTLLEPGLIECERVVSLPAPHGDCTLSRPAVVRMPFHGPGHAANPADLLFLDTETTGLAGGTGTLPFLVGMARYEDDALRVRQLFLTGFRAEGALLDAVAAWARPGARIVSFNGKAFDVPLLATRFRLSRRKDPLLGLEHVDLLHPTRNAYARRWQDCRLQTAEARLFGLVRDNDLPGHLIPYAWFNFVRQRVPGEVPRILEHNHWDVRSLAALLASLEEVYDNPALTEADTLGVARTHQRRGATQEALRLLAADAGRLDERGLLELAAMHRRHGEWPEAVAVWQQLDAAGCAQATESLAKYYEHEARDCAAALRYAQALVTRHPQATNHAARRDRLLRRLGGPTSSA